MLLLESVAVLGFAGLLIYGLLRLVMRPAEQPAPTASRWRIAHYDRSGTTRLVVQRVSSTGSTTLDEHLIATITVDDPEYDEKFMAAMAAARQRRAMFEAADD